MSRYRLRDAIGIALITGFLTSLGLLFFKLVPDGNRDLITYMLGQLSGFAGGIVAYHYATNAREQQATENTGRAFAAIEAAARSTPPIEEEPDVVLRPGETAQAAPTQETPHEPR